MGHPAPGVKTPGSVEGLDAQAEAWAYLRDKSKVQYGDSGCASMTS